MSIPFDPDWVVAPGEILAEWFEETGTPKSRAVVFGIPPAQLEGFLAGEELLTPELARQLRCLTRISESFWINSERIFRDGLAAGKTWVKS